MMSRVCSTLGAILVLAVGSRGAEPAGVDSCPSKWRGTWATAPQSVERKDLPADGSFEGGTLRQIVRVSAGGHQLRVRFSNEFGRSPLHLLAAHVAKPARGSSIVAGSGRALLFSGKPEVVVPPGAQMVADPADFDLEPLSDLAITIRCGGAFDGITGHPGSRATSYLATGAGVADVDLAAATPVDHWYFIRGVDVPAEGDGGAIAVLGDSITDGRGSTTNGNDRWPDQLAKRLLGQRGTAQFGVLNEGIGGNRLLRDGLGQCALARLDRDVLAQAGVRWVIVIEGVNDIGTSAQARARGESAPTAVDVIAALEQIAYRARSTGLRVLGGTILPFGGSFYDLPGAEADRKAVNDWIRNAHCFDAIIDFDAAVRDPGNPTRLAPPDDSGDHLHLTPAGYEQMADAVELNALRVGSTEGGGKQPDH